MGLPTLDLLFTHLLVLALSALLASSFLRGWESTPRKLSVTPSPALLAPSLVSSSTLEGERVKLTVIDVTRCAVCNNVLGYVKPEEE